MQIKSVIRSFMLSIIVTGSAIVQANEPDSDFTWPLEIESDNGYVTTLYQPQLESFVSDVLEGRMAVTINPPEAEIIFGAIWFKARMETDLDNRTVLLREMNIIKTHFPGEVTEEHSDKFARLLEAEIESWDLEMSLDRILASLDEVDNLKQISDKINNDPPTIYFRTNPAILLMIDGEPIFKKDDESGLEYVVNTPFFLVKEPKTGDYYINGGPFWYKSKEVKKGWNEAAQIPSSVKDFAKKYVYTAEADSVVQSYTSAPEIIIETKSAELILVDGEIDYKPVEGTTLLYVANSESDIIMDINSQNHYILIAGRWYYSKSLKDGDWKFCEPENLPSEFYEIPEESNLATVRASIPGTSEAEIALLEQSIPQTATIDRKTASVEVTYDGDPEFEKIPGTDISYALNTDMTVLKINNNYYVIDNAVWFESQRATGPWEVSTKRPDEVDEIPPESPVYNVKYTYIYESTPEVVYVGYLPGYNYSYVYGGVVVYGTGYYYPYWYRHYYYPRPVTYGYGVHYNPYTGWGFSVGISYGWIGWGYNPYHRCYWGPRGYYGGYRHGYHRGHHRGYHHGYNRGYRAGYAAGNRNVNRNVYNNRNTGVRTTGNTRNAQRPNNMNNKARPSNRSNNMYTDRNGNVYQRNNNGSFDNKSNRPSQGSGNRPSTGQQPSQRPSTGEQPTQRPSTGQQPRQRPSTGQQPSTRPQTRPSQSQNQQLNRSYQNRSQGTQNYNRSQQQRSGSRPAGGGSRGGGRR